MHCPRLAELPPPPGGKTGWPWTVETPHLPPTRPDGSPWPRISIVTPSFNQGQFIEETIRSVLLQGYPDLEYIVIDGGSADKSVEIIRKYEPWLTYWVSEKDRGQAHAINKGFRHTTGEVGAYLNSDDFYAPGVLTYVAESYNRHSWRLFIGRRYRSQFLYPKCLRRTWWRHNALPPLPFLNGEVYGVCQESTFWSRTETDRMEFDENLHFCLDADWYARIAPGAKILLTSRQIGYFRQHVTQKTAVLQEVFNAEADPNCARYKQYRVDRVANKNILAEYRSRFARLLLDRLYKGTAEFVYRHPA